MQEVFLKKDNFFVAGGGAPPPASYVDSAAAVVAAAAAVIATAAAVAAATPTTAAAADQDDDQNDPQAAAAAKAAEPAAVVAPHNEVPPNEMVDRLRPPPHPMRGQRFRAPQIKTYIRETVTPDRTAVTTASSSAPAATSRCWRVPLPSFWAASRAK